MSEHKQRALPDGGHMTLSPTRCREIHVTPLPVDVAAAGLQLYEEMRKRLMDVPSSFAEFNARVLVGGWQLLETKLDEPEPAVEASPIWTPS